MGICVNGHTCEFSEIGNMTDTTGRALVKDLTESQTADGPL
jgi:hypothetical protein